ncbi:MAG TPA: hypothetical protein VGS97_21690 [Actinocrinis sp.]|uniref:hypothetical protein n=1 Tax=Actinocrinis sp. TaxID=1920516 RepID=UPI002DDCE204|nr:hypothetical protein [Actinocrinis sp.]HEV2346729.1 hypothetical protein [Actinocrinis sp.]
MSHAGRRIASTAAAAAAVALPVAAAGSAYADTLPVVGQLPVVGNLANSATANTGSLTQAVPLANLPVVGGLTNTANTGSALNNLPVVSGLTSGGLTPGGLSNVAGLAGNSGTSSLDSLSMLNALTTALSRGGLPLVGNFSGLDNLTGFGSALAQGRSSAVSAVPESVPMQSAQQEATATVAQAPAAAEHEVAAPQHVATSSLRHVATDAQKLTTHYIPKHAATSKAAHSNKTAHSAKG